MLIKDYIMSIIKDLSNVAAKGRQFVYAVIGKEEKIMEVELWGWGDHEGINEDEERAWALIKYLYHNVLINDDNWHFFYENFYNIIRCSESFYPEVIKELDAFGVCYQEKGEWIDGSETVKKYHNIYRDLFHNFSLMALQEYEYTDIHLIYDRLSHCFLNHQFYVLEEYRENHGRQWEASIMNHTSMHRAEYTGMMTKDGVNASKSNSINTEYRTIPEQVEERERRIAEEEEDND
jgi:hypothetical protein